MANRLPGNAWPYPPSTIAQMDYWGLHFLNFPKQENNKQRLQQPRHRLQSPNLKSSYGIKNLEKDFFTKGKKHKKPKHLNTTESIIKRII